MQPEKTQRGYDESVREVFKTLDQELIEIDDWNCCGATVYMSVKETVSLAVSHETSLWPRKWEWTSWRHAAPASRSFPRPTAC